VQLEVYGKNKLYREENIQKYMKLIRKYKFLDAIRAKTLENALTCP